jgi:hypothetical protein
MNAVANSVILRASYIYDLIFTIFNYNFYKTVFKMAQIMYGLKVSSSPLLMKNSGCRPVSIYLIYKFKFGFHNNFCHIIIEFINVIYLGRFTKYSSFIIWFLGAFQICEKRLLPSLYLYVYLLAM